MDFITRVRTADPIALLTAVMGIFTLVYLVMFIRAMVRDAGAGESVKSPILVWPVSFVANFFDTLGVGSYATTTAMVRFFTERGVSRYNLWLLSAAGSSVAAAEAAPEVPRIADVVPHIAAAMDLGLSDRPDFITSLHTPPCTIPA